jgi:hypothetical protein
MGKGGTELKSHAKTQKETANGHEAEHKWTRIEEKKLSRKGAKDRG